MNFKKKKNEVSDIIKLYLKNEKTLKDLQDYAWKAIDESSNNDQINKPTDETESVFWFAIWQIQHLGSEEHVKDGTLERELKLTLQYLLNQAPMPPGAYGLPPSKKTKKTSGSLGRPLL